MGLVCLLRVVATVFDCPYRVTGDAADGSSPPASAPCGGGGCATPTLTPWTAWHAASPLENCQGCWWPHILLPHNNQVLFSVCVCVCVCMYVCMYVWECKAATFLALVGFPAWRDVRTSMFWQLKICEQFVPVWQHFYWDYSVLAMCTDFLWLSVQQENCWWPILTNDKQTGKHRFIL